jgi:hypothetical protein
MDLAPQLVRVVWGLMPLELDLDAVLARRREIADEMGKLSAEDADLEVVVRVAKRFGNGMENGAAGSNKLGPARPDGTPSLFDMTEAVIGEAMKHGKDGLNAQEIVAAIGKKYWPGVKGAQILPSVYGFAKQGRLKKNAKGLFLALI